MKTRTHKSSIKKVSFIVLFLCSVQWAHGGVFLCIGADGHIAYAQVASTGCYKKNSIDLSPDIRLHTGSDHCADVPAWTRKFTSRNRRGVSRYRDAVAVRLDFLSPFPGLRFARIPRSLDMTFPDDQLSAALETVVLIV